LGTSSHVGKSTIVTGLCRILSDKGVTVAPFKAQHTSSRSCVLDNGCEIARSQAAQAEAARAKPSGLMNPVLLKPAGNNRSEVILLGKPFSFDEVSEYYQKTDYLLEKAAEAYHALEKECQVIVVEGAGGAAEVNLYEKDIANILPAQKLRIPVILVADIERGGVFAQVYGTIRLLPDDVRPLVKGVIVNKFSGDIKLFNDGRKILEELTGIPVLGIVPELKLNFPEEDSLAPENPDAVMSSAAAEAEYDRLAAALETVLDIDTLVSIALGRGH
ncbi:MAG: cobyric acid synthase, partial [Methanocorpusculum sp.]|nr:cobyric acid synthase [Candidatus Methanocorpusculum equi]